MKIRFLPLLLISSFVFAQESVEQPIEPIITDLDRLVESVKKTASSRSAEDNARLQRFLADKNRQQYLLNQNKFRNYVHDQSLQAFKPFLLKAAKKLVPLLQSNEIEMSDKSGIRAQLYNKKESKLVEDFIYINSLNSTHILNAVSPAFTSSFALADLIINSSNVIDAL